MYMCKYVVKIILVNLLRNLWIDPKRRLVANTNDSHI